MMEELESAALSAPLLLTPEGYKSLQQELENLTLVKRAEIAERSRDSLPQFCLNVLLPAIAATSAARTAATQREPYRRG